VKESACGVQDENSQPQGKKAPISDGGSFTKDALEKKKKHESLLSKIAKGTRNGEESCRLAIAERSMAWIQKRGI